MTLAADQILTVAQMRDAEEALIGAGSSVEALMQIAGRGAAEWVWRMAAHRPVTVLTGPGNNGGDGYVIAEALRERGGSVSVVAASEPRTEAAARARAAYRGAVLDGAGGAKGEILVDCLFGSGLARPLTDEHRALLVRLAAHHRHCIAIDVPSGIEVDSGAVLTSDLPYYDLTIALGAWKFAHFLMPSVVHCGALRLVEIGVKSVPGAASRISRPKITAPAAGSHKYKRGLLAVVGGEMLGASLLACDAAKRSGAGYVKLFSDSEHNTPHDLVVDTEKLSSVLTDDRNQAILVGPGLGRRAEARQRLAIALADQVPAVLDADALLLVGERSLASREAPAIATPHEGELAKLEETFELESNGTKPERAFGLARKSGMVIVAKGPDTVIAAPDGRIVCAPLGTSWLSTAGTGDVLAGIIASRLATGVEAFAAACEGVWLQREAADHCSPGFSAGDLAGAVPAALASCL